MLANSWYLKKILERLEISVSFVELIWISEEWRQSLKLLEPGRFDAHKNATAPMIVMLDCLEIDMKVSDTGMETMESNDCKEVSRDNRNANSVLTTAQEEARFCCKDG